MLYNCHNRSRLFFPAALDLTVLSHLPSLQMCAVHTGALRALTHSYTLERQTEPAPSRPRSARLRAVAADVLLLHCVHQTCLQCSRKLKAHGGCSKRRKKCSHGSPNCTQQFFSDYDICTRHKRREKIIKNTK